MVWKWSSGFFQLFQLHNTILCGKYWIKTLHALLPEKSLKLACLYRGLLSRSILQAQSASPIFTHVYAALVAIINSKFPNIGELILKRLILNFRKGYRRNDKVCKMWRSNCWNVEFCCVTVSGVFKGALKEHSQVYRTSSSVRVSWKFDNLFWMDTVIVWGCFVLVRGV